MRDSDKVYYKGYRQLKIQDATYCKHIKHFVIFAFGAPVKEKEAEWHDGGVEKIQKKVLNQHYSVLAGESVTLLPLGETLNNFFHDKVGDLNTDREENGQQVVTGPSVSLL